MKIILIITGCLLSFFPLCAQPADSVSSLEGPTSTACRIVAVAIPSTMLLYGLLSLGDNGIRQLDYNVRDCLKERDAFWDTRIDDYVQFAPAVAAFGMKLGGVKSKHGLGDMAIIYALANLLETGLVYGTKQWIQRDRPDDSNNHSFPSGHTATAFVAAEFLHQEYKDQSAWISIGGYAAASFVGLARIYNNKHWLSDVLAGAGVGILSVKIVYWLYPYLQEVFGCQHKSLNAFILPSYNDGRWGLTMAYTF